MINITKNKRANIIWFFYDYIILMSLGLFMNIYINIEETSFFISWSMNSGLNDWH